MFTGPHASGSNPHNTGSRSQLYYHFDHYCQLWTTTSTWLLSLDFQWSVTIFTSSRLFHAMLYKPATICCTCLCPLQLIEWAVSSEWVCTHWLIQLGIRASSWNWTKQGGWTPVGHSKKVFFSQHHDTFGPLQSCAPESEVPLLRSLLNSLENQGWGIRTTIGQVERYVGQRREGTEGSSWIGSKKGPVDWVLKIWDQLNGF